MDRALWRMEEAQTDLDRESSQEFTVGVRETTLCPPPLSKKKKKKRRTSLAATAYGELSQFLFLYIKCKAFQVEPFVAYTTCDLGSCVVTQTLWLFDISVSAVWQVSVTHAFFSLPPFYSLPHRLISRHQAPVVMAKLHLNPQYFPGVFQPAAVSHINARHALRQTELNWSTL